VRKSVSWLVRLGFEDRARDAFFESRTETIKKLTRQISFEGDIPLYISQVCLVQFTLIKNSVEVFNSCFEYRLSSALVQWAKARIEEFADLLERQLDGVDRKNRAYRDCMDVVKGHSAMLVEVGLDFIKEKDVLTALKSLKTGVGLGSVQAPPPSVGLGVKV